MRPMLRAILMVGAGAAMLAMSFFVSEVGLDFLLRGAGGVLVLVGLLTRERFPGVMTLGLSGFTGYVALIAFLEFTRASLALAAASALLGVGVSIFWLVNPTRGSTP